MIAHRRIFFFACWLVPVIGGLALPNQVIGSDSQQVRPNILFIAMDDLNDWIEPLGGHPQTRTPNLSRLAKRSVLFTNAHCAAPACNPSRTAIFTGRSPHRSGLYDNRQKMREVLPDAAIIPKVFSGHGYHSSGSGKMLHYFIDADSWDEYYPEAKSEDPFPRTFYPASRPVNLPRGGPWQYVETDWAALDVSDEQFGGDYSVAQWVSQQLQVEREQPFFLACGLYRPHEPWFVPKSYYEPFPLESIRLPPGYRADDLNDVSDAAKRIAKNRYFDHIQSVGQWKRGIQGYLASIHFADAMLGHVLDALEKSPHAQDTIVVLWSDHGWHLGEKEHWQKYTAWRQCTRVPLMISVPANSSRKLPEGTKPGRCNEPVSLVSLFPTLLELADLPAQDEHDGPSLLPLLQQSKEDWPHVAITYLGRPGSFGLSDQRFRLVQYAGGEQELYDTQSDPYEWENLVADPEHAATLDRLSTLVPKQFAKLKPPSISALTKLKWQPITRDSAASAPPSKPDGNPFEVVFRNRSGRELEICWMDRSGQPKSYGTIGVNQDRRQRTRPGAVWMIRSLDSVQLGFFRIGDRTAKAIIPKIE